MSAVVADSDICYVTPTRHAWQARLAHRPCATASSFCVVPATCAASVGCTWGAVCSLC